MNFDYTLSGVFPVPIHCLYLNNFEKMNLNKQELTKI